jgi:CRISPR-associated endonuclease/helicase Cas3
MDEDPVDEEASRLLTEGWQSEFIITTFVQFFHTLISNKNRAIRKFHTLANAIIILDEVQSIPHQYWLLFHEALEVLTQLLNTRIIFVTATQPLIFDESQKGEILELATNKRAYFSQLDRVELTFSGQPLPLQDFVDEIKERLSKETTKDFLIVLNTIKSAEYLFSKISCVPFADTECIFLSTHIIPKERLARIANIRDPKNKVRKIIVSTPLIEAGVDIDVDVVYRDIAPLDSINQVAGRCNRHDNPNRHGEVRIVALTNNGRPLSSMIYSQFLLDKTRMLLEGKGTIHEHEFLSLNDNYYQLVKELHSDDEAEKCLELLRFLKFSDLSKSFHLIKNDYPRTDIFVEFDMAAEKIWKKFVEIKSGPYTDRKREFQKIKHQFLDYVISVPENDGIRLIREDLEIGYISHDELQIWYNDKTGFKAETGGTLVT